MVATCHTKSVLDQQLRICSEVLYQNLYLKFFGTKKTRFTFIKTLPLSSPILTIHYITLGREGKPTHSFVLMPTLV